MVRSAADTLLAAEIAFHLKAIRDLCVECDVESLEVFGSASVGPFDPNESDADFLVTFHADDLRRGFDDIGHLMSFEERLAEILDRPVDVSTSITFRNPYFARTVSRSRRLLYGTAPVQQSIPEDIAMTDPTHERTLKLLEDIRFAARALVDESEGQTFDDLLRDLRYRLFVERGFEIVGEATRRLRDEDPAMFDRLPEGTKIVGTRNVIVHGYDEINYETLWNAIQTRVPRLLSEVERLMQDLRG